MDRLLSGALNLTVLSLTAAVGGASLMAGYWAVVQLLQGQMVLGCSELGVSSRWQSAHGDWSTIAMIL